MARFSHKSWVGGLIAAFLAISAVAGPPLIHDGSRTYGNSMGGDRCDTIGNLYRCVGVHAWENYDVKGTFEFTEVAISLYTYRSFDDGGWSEGWRSLACPVDKNAIVVHPNKLTLAAVLDPSAPGCYSQGQRVTWDPVDGYSVEPFDWTEPRSVTGEWADPLSYSKSISTHRDSFYDGWSDTDNTAVRHCNESFGDLMKEGGFSFGISNRWYAFEGVDTPGWSYFQTISCNENHKQQ